MPLLWFSYVWTAPREIEPWHVQPRSKWQRRRSPTNGLAARIAARDPSTLPHAMHPQEQAQDG